MIRPPTLSPVEDNVKRAAEAFRSDPKSRRVLWGIWRKKKRYRFYPTQLLVEHVLHYLGEDPRSWRDWIHAVIEAMNIVLWEAGEISRKKETG